MGEDQRAGLIWRAGGLPVSRRFDDPYFSLENGLEETRHVFLDGNDLPARLRPGFSVAELGFGTGLNLLALASVWNGPDKIFFTSFEAYPIKPDEMARALAAFPTLAEPARRLVRFCRDGLREFTLGKVRAELVIGDARETLPRWHGRADAWFLDGFSPAKNPELWEEPLLRQVASHTAPGGTFATYTAAGAVRRALDRAGFVVERCAGFGRKRHMSRGRLP